MILGIVSEPPSAGLLLASVADRSVSAVGTGMASPVEGIPSIAGNVTAGSDPGAVNGEAKDGATAHTLQAAADAGLFTR